jgi:predicted component of type VI protein secretion system
MALRMRVVGSHAARLGNKSTRVFGVHGGRIGRAHDNDWVLPDPERYISGYHASIEYRSGQWLVVDTSSNGTYLNGDEYPLRDGGARALKDGDHLRMGDYEIHVSISPDNDFPPDSLSIPGYGGGPGEDFAIATHGDIGADLDMVSLLADPSGPPELPARIRASDAYGQSAEIPTLVPELVVRPTVRPKEPASPPEPRREPDPVVSLAAAVQLLARGAGLDATGIPAERHTMVLGVAGQLLREMAQGLSAALKARAETRPVGPAAADSPLESNDSVEAVLGRLLGPVRLNAPLAVESVREGFAGLRHHQLATHAALRLALDEYVKRFAPANLQAQFDQAQARAAAAPDKHRYWDMYTEMFRVLSQSNAQGLPHAFAEAFARAYAVQAPTPATSTAGTRGERGSS